jgi:hypothetical protein
MSTLCIEINGLCLFVPDGDQLHVLMPMTGPNSLGEVPSHQAILTIPPKHSSDGSEQCVILDGHQLSVLFAGSPRSSGPALRERMLNLHEVTEKAVSDSALTGDGGGVLQARVSLGSGHVGKNPPGARFWWRKGDKANTSYQIEWEIPNAADVLSLSPTPLKGVGTQPVITAKASGGCINLRLTHLPVPARQSGDHCMPRKVRGAASPHFIAFYSLFDPPVEMLLPIFETDAPKVATEDAQSAGLWVPAGDPFSCVNCQVAE